MPTSDMILALDIETVPDDTLSGWDQTKFPPPMACRVVAIGGLAAKVTGNGAGKRITIDRLHCHVRHDEEAMLRRFWASFGRHMPLVVTWNGRGFDVPVLTQRAFKYGIPIPGWFQSGTRFESYVYRYCPDRHCDLMDQLSDYGACRNTKMDLIAVAAGFPGKIGGHGSEVKALFEAGELDRIGAYCECDVLNLYGIWLRWALVTGRIDQECHDLALEDLVAYLNACGTEKPHCAMFRSMWRPIAGTVCGGEGVENAEGTNDELPPVPCRA